LPILKTFVPHTEQVPVVAGFPFFIVVAVGFLISRFALHLTQYASITLIPFSNTPSILIVRSVNLRR
jgi:hypothetical protein